MTSEQTKKRAVPDTIDTTIPASKKRETRPIEYYSFKTLFISCIQLPDAGVSPKTWRVTWQVTLASDADLPWETTLVFVGKTVTEQKYDRVNYSHRISVDIDENTKQVFMYGHNYHRIVLLFLDDESECVDSYSTPKVLDLPDGFSKHTKMCSHEELGQERCHVLIDKILATIERSMLKYEKNVVIPLPDEAMRINSEYILDTLYGLGYSVIENGTNLEIDLTID